MTPLAHQAPTKLDILDSVHALGWCTARQVADHTGRDIARVSQCLSKATSMGHVQRAGPRGRSEWRLTDRGRAWLGLVAPGSTRGPVHALLDELDVPPGDLETRRRWLTSRVHYHTRGRGLASVDHRGAGPTENHDANPRPDPGR